MDFYQEDLRSLIARMDTLLQIPRGSDTEVHNAERSLALDLIAAEIDGLYEQYALELKTVEDELKYEALLKALKAKSLAEIEAFIN